MECAGRGLNFWSYQATQEIVYQEFIAKSLADKYNSLSMQMDKIIHDANTEISSLRNKISAMQIDQEHAQHKNHELAEAFREKSRKHLQIQELYDKLKRQTLYSQVQNAALETVDRTIHTPSFTSKTQQVTGGAQNQLRHQRLPVDRQGVEQVHSRQRSGSASSGSPKHMAGNMGPPLSMTSNQGSGLWTGNNTRVASSQLHPMSTPSQHRQRLPAPRRQTQSNPRSSSSHSNSFDSRVSSNAVNARRSLSSLSLNPTGSFSGYGMRAGLKIGREQVHGLGGSETAAQHTTNGTGSIQDMMGNQPLKFGASREIGDYQSGAFF
ncbi:MAG: hypothetical protein M1839_005866 [Geoglossum umbratile]|nr:MAG: hypothetical protein M1839_005866 [Geoglossum umbratile]